MRTTATLVFVFVFCFFTNAQELDIEKISPALWEQMLESGQQTLPVYILLEDQVDVLGLRTSFNNHKTSLKKRSQILIPALMEKAASTQGPLLEYLRGLPNIDTDRIVGLWVTNVIQTELTISQIKEISLRRDVGKMEYISPEIAFSPETTAAAPVSPNGSELGLRSIKADKLWQMGYSGYGRRIMIQDSGVELVHPALRLNYQGYHVAFDRYAYTGGNVAGPNDCAINGIHHGTHVAGTTCGLDRLNNDTIGVAHNAKWLAAPLANLTGACDEARWGQIQNYEWAINPDGDANTINDMPDAINNSFGSQGDCQNTSTIANAQDAVETAGIAIVWAAGNDGPGVSTTSTSSDINHDLVISFSVAALNPNATTAIGFSSRGPSDCGETGSLLIKPEVSAPGVNVRSSNGISGYQNSSGTSMAAPHVAGAIVLLKEAFPELTGEAIKLALYQTASDLGPVGEDNTYGMGIINVLDAFNFLVAEGNIPTNPQRDEDVMVVNIKAVDQECGFGLFAAEVMIENGGDNTLTNAVIDYEFISNGSSTGTGTINWTGSLEKGAREVITIPETSNLNGNYNFRITVHTPNGIEDQRPLNNIYQIPVKVVEVEPIESAIAGEELGNPCAGSSTFVELINPDVIDADWFVQPTGGSAFTNGLYFETPTLPNPFTFYVEAVLKGSGGITDITTTEVQTGEEPGKGLVFNVIQDIRLKSTKVYADEPGIRLVKILRPNGATVALRTLNTPVTGELIVDWNVDIPAGEGYIIEQTVGAPLEYTTNPAYPYSVGGALSIIGTNELIDPFENYYYFYDWDFEYNYACGRIPVIVEFGGMDGPTVDFSLSNNLPASGETLTFTNASENATEYFWKFGDGTTSTEENPMHVYQDEGTYLVTLSAVNGDGCAVTTSQEVVVSLMTNTRDQMLDESLNLYPNPTTGKLNIDLGVNYDHALTEIRMVDLLGRTVQQLTGSQIQGNNLEIDMTDLNNGVYHLIFVANDARTTRRVVKMD